MGKSIDINVHHVTRVEGHGNILVKAQDGKIEKVEWQVPEAPRFFEAMVRGRNYLDIQTIVSRICGICSVTHSLAAIKGVEDALEIEVSPQTDKLRILAHYSEQVESHSLHLGYLVAPDLLGVNSVVPLVASHPDVVKTVISLHKLGNQWMELLTGRMTHPVTIVPGGFTKLPTEAELRGLQKKIKEGIPALNTLKDVILSLASRLPAFDRPTEYVAVKDKSVYSFYHGDIASTDIEKTEDVHNFESCVNEYVSPQSTAKWTKWHRDSYAVGALARFNVNADLLLPMAKDVAKEFGLKKGCCNPYMNNVAQLLELYQVAEHGLQLIDEVLTASIKPEKPVSRPKAGEGVGCVEAPRGILFHRYAFDARGNCTRANICIPTGQNHANIQKDFEVLVPQFMDRGQDELKLIMEMLVRSYDPCISCSTHFLNIDFV
ncbi:MAG: Ni/Fe hydrogenase subunit alpha [Spirochaetales bacterium]|nr:Ni/Fe hydrogenase subunit alpha [Spirochaetales bacterium]